MDITDRVIALAGNPNVGKSTVFNGLTGMNQHTGNWPGKTVTGAQGRCHSEKHAYIMVDIPGTYSLMAHSAEEEVARNFICFGRSDAVVVVCDATCLERNLNLVLQTMEISQSVIVCVNLMDEAERKKIKLDLGMLSNRLGVPVVGITARKKRTLKELVRVMDDVTEGATEDAICRRHIGVTIDEGAGTSGDGTNCLRNKKMVTVRYHDAVETAIAMLEEHVKPYAEGSISSRWLSLKLLEGDEALIKEAEDYLGKKFYGSPKLQAAMAQAHEMLNAYGIDDNTFKDMVVSALVKKSEELCRGVVICEDESYNRFDRRVDRILTSRVTGYPIMVSLLAVVFWITIAGANYPSGLLADGFFWFQDRLTEFFGYINAPDWLHGVLVLGVYRVLAWVVSVMLPPMAIFFPLFTLLEDVGYLPRIAYNLDKPFKRCCACGKQALTMCMGFGCNAAGIVGCRIIDSPRERLLAILTNNFVPCNGRFPTLIAILSMFFVGAAGGAFSSLTAALLLTAVILTGVVATFFITKILSMTLLKGVPSSFTLELPPYRRPQVGRVIVRSIFDRTLFVLGRAVLVAAPVGMIIWVMANISVGDASILNHCASFLDPFARLMGLDGIILLAFILGFPANEIVIPIIIMAYMAQGSILELDNLEEMKQLFLTNGWTWVTAICTMLFSLFHWPCSTTLLTIRKETGSWKWTGLAAAIPTAGGISICILFASVAKAFI